MNFNEEKYSLKKKNQLTSPSPWPPTPKNDPPRSLRSLGKIVEGNLCHRCGTCIGICPTDTLDVDEEEYPRVKSLSACTDCELCVKVCPGVEFKSIEMAKKIFGFVPDIKDMHGHFEKAMLGHAKDDDLRKSGTSGGLITALLISMLKRGKIDGAVVVTSCKKDLWKGKPIIARTEEELLLSTKSKYAIVPTNKIISEIRTTEGRYALVGLPCQIHGFHKAAALDKKIAERVVLTIGLFCHAAIEHEPMQFIWQNIQDKENVTQFISRVGKHPGTPHVRKKDGFLSPVYFPRARAYRPNSMEILNILYRLYTPARCLTCYDSTAEFADIAVGDPWMAPPNDKVDFFCGYSFALGRTDQGVRALSEAANIGDIKLLHLDKKRAQTSNTMMGNEKRWRAFRVIQTLKRRGKPIPDYDFDTPRASGKHLVLTEFNMLSHIACFMPKFRKLMLKATFSPLGYVFLWINNKKRRFRNWRRNTIAKRNS